MHSRRLAQRAIPATVALAFALASGAVAAQTADSQEVRIRGMPFVLTTQGHSPTGIQDQSLQLSQNISYADLNLATPAGQDELAARVRDAANSVCAQLGKADPDPTVMAEQQDQTNCVNNAVYDAMSQVRHVEASSAGPRQRR